MGVLLVGSEVGSGSTSMPAGVALLRKALGLSLGSPWPGVPTTSRVWYTSCASFWKERLVSSVTPALATSRANFCNALRFFALSTSHSWYDGTSDYEYEGKHYCLIAFLSQLP